MTSRSFRRLFPQLNVQSVPEDEFYRQAVLSQLLTAPDEQDLASFRPDVKDPLELVEATPELAAMLGSSLEFVDSRWDSLGASPPPSPPGVPWLPSRTAESALGSGLPPELEPKLDSSRWDPEKQQSKKTISCSVWEQSKCVVLTSSAGSDPKMDFRPQSKSSDHTQQSQEAAGVKSNLWENTGPTSSATPDLKSDVSSDQDESSPTPGISSPGPDPKLDSSLREPKAGTPGQPEVAVSMWEPQRLRNRNTLNSDTKVDAAWSEPQRLRNRNPTTDRPANSNSAADASVWKRQVQGSKAGTQPTTRSQDGAASSRTPGARLDSWEQGGSPEPRREASCSGSLGDWAWQRSLGSVRVHIRDVGLRAGLRKEPGKVVRLKTKS